MMDDTTLRQGAVLPLHSGRPAPSAFNLLIPIWGERYIRRFAELGLRSLLAPANLPQLCHDYHVKMTVLTDRDGISSCRMWPAFRAAARMVPVEFVPIDDLIAAYRPNYSVVLTRAFNRGMALTEDFCGTCFIYLVGDQVFADGSLTELARAMASGADACLACTPRVDADAAAPLLTRRSAEPLALSPRELADVMLNFPHPTLAAKLVRDDKIQLQAAHQFFWHPAADTLVARCFLLHMLSIRPTRRPDDIAAFCDFSFVDALAPQGHYHFLDDSDTFLAIELQDRGHEAEFIVPYTLSPMEVARSVSAWATPVHHEFITATFVFRGGNSTYSRAVAKELTEGYIAELCRDLAPPLDHRHHPFWLGAVGAELLMTPAEDAPAAGEDLPAVLQSLIVKHLGAADSGRVDIAVAARDRSSSLDELLAARSRTSVRVSVQFLCDRIADIAGSKGTLLAVLFGNGHDLVDLLSRRRSIAQLARIVGPGRTVLLCYRIESEFFNSHGPSRKDLYHQISSYFPLFVLSGVALRLHDLGPEPLDAASGVVIEIVAEDIEVRNNRRNLAFREPEDDPLFGLRGEQPEKTYHALQGATAVDHTTVTTDERDDA